MNSEPSKTTIRIHPSYSLYSLGEDKYRIIGPMRRFDLKDKTGILRQVLPSLSSDIDLRGIINGLPLEDQESAEIVIGVLSEANILIEDDIDLSLDPIAHVLDLSERQIRSIGGHSTTPLSERECQISLLNKNLQPVIFTEALTRMGLKVVDGDQPTTGFDLAVAMIPRNDLLVAERTNARVVKDRIPTLFVLFDTHTIVIGPHYIPNDAACLACAEERWQSNAIRPETDQQEELIPIKLQPDSIAQFVAYQLAAVRIAAIARGLSNVSPPGEIVEFDLVAMEIRKGRAVRAPRCPVCSSRSTSPFAARSVRAANVD
jgi:bacteriocin biosynthesis cyclodehydratase domain-containing protein